MLSSRLFWKLFLAYTALVLLAVSACVAIVSGWQEEQLIEQVRRRLQVSAVLLRSDVAEKMRLGRSLELQDQVRSVGQKTSTRFTLVAKDGKVLADSEQPTLEAVAAMENHLTRQEFVLAARSGEGISRRSSPTLGVPFLYYAIVLEQNGKTLGFVRSAQPIASIREEVASIRRLIWLVGLLVGLTGLVISYWLTKRLVSPIRELTCAAEGIASGNFSQRVHVASSDELVVTSKQLYKSLYNVSG